MCKTTRMRQFSVVSAATFDFTRKVVSRGYSSTSSLHSHIKLKKAIKKIRVFFSFCIIYAFDGLMMTIKISKRSKNKNKIKMEWKYVNRSRRRLKIVLEKNEYNIRVIFLFVWFFFFYLRFRVQKWKISVHLFWATQINVGVCKLMALEQQQVDAMAYRV